MVMMSSMKPSIDASVYVISTAKRSVVAIWLADIFLSSCESKDRHGEFKSSVSKDSSQSGSLPRYIAASLTVIYSNGAGVVPKGKPKQRKASSSTFAIHVKAVLRLHVSGGRMRPGMFSQ